MIIIGAAVGPILTNAGFKISGAIIEVVPAGVAQEIITTGVSIRAILQTLKTAVGTVRFWADLGLTFVLMTGDALVAEGAFYTFGQLDNELQDILLDHEVGSNAVKTRDLLKEILDSSSSSSDPALEADIKDLKNRTEQELQLYFNMGWQNDTLEHRVLHREAVVTLYALEYIRAEMANLKDYLRFRKAAVDIGQVYLSGNLTNLIDREELHEMIKAAVIQREIKERAQMRIDEQKARNNPWGESLYWTRFGIHM